MRFFDAGVEPVGFIAVGASATGVIAIGELGTGVIAVGQLSRGIISIGQLSVGFIAIGQLAIGVAWALGQIGIAALAGPGLVLGLFGRFYPSRVLHRDLGDPLEPAGLDLGPRLALRVGAFAIVALLWVLVAGRDVTTNLDLSPSSSPTPALVTTTTIHHPG